MEISEKINCGRNVLFNNEEGDPHWYPGMLDLMVVW